MVDVVRNVTVRGHSEGMDTLASAIHKVREAQDALARSSSSGSGVEGTTRGILSAQAAWERYENRVDAAARAARNAERDLGTVNRVFDQGRISSERYSEELTRIQANLDKVSAANTRLNATQKLVDEGLVASARMRAARQAEADAYDARIAQQKLDATAEANQAAVHAAWVVPDARGQGRSSAEAFQAAQAEQDMLNRAMQQRQAQIAQREADARVLEQRQAQARADQQAEANQAAFSSFMGIGGPTNSSRASAAAFEEAFREQDAMARAANELRAKIDPVGHAFMILGEEIAQYNKMAASGVISTQELGRAIQGAQDKFANTQRNYGGDRNAQAGKFFSQQGQNLQFQLNDVISGYMMGQSPLTIVQQQGGQVYQSLSMAEGGASAGIKMLGETAARWLTPTVGIMGGLTAAVAAAALAHRSLAASQREVDLSLIGAGRASGATAGGIERIAVGQNSVSAGAARSMAAEFAGTGRIGMEMYADLIKATKEYAHLTGTDLAAAQKIMAGAFADPAKGAAELDKVLGGLDDRTEQLIIHMQASGDRAGAQRAMYDAFAGTLRKATEDMTFWQKELEIAGKEWDGFWEKVGRGGARLAQGGDTLEDQLRNARKILESARARQGATFGALLPGVAASDVASSQKAVDDLVAKLDDKKVSAFAAAAAQTSKEIGAIMRAAMPADEELKKLNDEYQRLQSAVRDPIRANLFGDGLKEAITLTETYSRRIQNLTEDIRNFGSAAQGQLMRASEQANRTVGFSGYGRSVADINARAAEEARNADSRELGAIERRRRLDIETATQGYRQTAPQYRIGVNQVPSQYQATIIEAAQRAGNVDPSLLASVLRQESGNFDPRVISGQRRSSAGAIGIAQFMPGTAREYGVNPLDPTSSINGAASYLSRYLGQYNNNVEATLAAYNAGPKWGNKLASGQIGIADLPRETQDYIAKITQQTPALDQQTQQVKGWNDAVADQGRILDATSRAWDGSQSSIDRATFSQEKMNDLIKSGLPVTAESAKLIGALADQYATLQQRSAAINLSRQLAFDRSDLGLNERDAAATRRVRGAGIDTESAAGRALIEQAKLNDQLREAKDLTSSVFKGMGQDLLSGASAADALHNALGKIQSRLLDMAIDNLVSNAFKGLLGGSGGAGGGILGVFGLGGGSSGGFDQGGGSYSTPLGDMTGVPMHADGGMIRGPGTSRSDSILARLSDGEFIVNARATSQHLDILQAINASGLPGFASGGLAGGPSAADLMAMRGVTAPGGVHGDIIVNNFSGQPVETKRTNGPQGPRTEITVGKAVEGYLTSPEAAPLLRKLGVNRMAQGR